MNREQNMQEESEPELSALLRKALRAETPAGLSDEQHVRLQEACAEFEAEARAPRSAGRERSVPRRARLGWLALACALPLAGYFGVEALVRHERAAAALELVQARERERDAAQARAVSERQQQALEKLRADARALAAAKAAAKAAADAAAASQPTQAAVASAGHMAEGSDSQRETKALRVASKSSARSEKASSSKAAHDSPGASSSGARSKSSAGGCDPNDPLCGL